MSWKTESHQVVYNILDISAIFSYFISFFKPYNKLLYNYNIIIFLVWYRSSFLKKCYFIKDYIIIIIMYTVTLYIFILLNINFIISFLIIKMLFWFWLFLFNNEIADDIPQIIIKGQNWWFPIPPFSVSKKLFWYYLYYIHIFSTFCTAHLIRKGKKLKW